MALSSLTATVKASASWTATTSLTGTDYTATTQASSVTKTLSLGTAAVNAAVGGADELVSKIFVVNANTNTSIDLTSVADVMGTTVTLARAKALFIRLLSTTDDATNGTTCTSITLDGSVTNGFLSQSANRGWLASNTSSFDVANGDFVAWGTARNTGIPVNSTVKILKVINNDVTNNAAVQVTAVGGTT